MCAVMASVSHASDPWRRREALSFVVVIVVFGLETCFGEGFGRGVVDADAARAAGLDDGRVDDYHRELEDEALEGKESDVCSDSANEEGRRGEDKTED